jgi:hypothetical protein
MNGDIISLHLSGSLMVSSSNLLEWVLRRKFSQLTGYEWVSGLLESCLGYGFNG